MAELPLCLTWAMHAAIQLICCSIDVTMLVKTEGLPGPVTMNMFGKPEIAMPI